MRLRYDPDEKTSALVAIFNGVPGEQRFANRTGTNFPIGDPPLVMAEVQYRDNQEQVAEALATRLKLGGYQHFGNFDDQRFDRVGVSLASLSSDGIARRIRGSSGIYGVIDQQIYRPQGGDHESGVSLYARVAGSPSDVALVDIWADGGIVFANMIDGRPNDKFGASFIYAKIARVPKPLIATLHASPKLFSQSAVMRPRSSLATKLRSYPAGSCSPILDTFSILVAVSSIRADLKRRSRAAPSLASGRRSFTRASGRQTVFGFRENPMRKHDALERFRFNLVRILRRRRSWRTLRA
ncbi:carbohydrate porin [Methylobacterium iners]|uniref:carbohydrate porin n=1 Tax=Methylobacterium iners TaxID=418707 RepID=UPI00403990AA